MPFLLLVVVVVVIVVVVSIETGETDGENSKQGSTNTLNQKIQASQPTTTTCNMKNKQIIIIIIKMSYDVWPLLETGGVLG